MFKNIFGRLKNEPEQKSQREVSAYNPFITIGGYKATPPKKDGKCLRNWSRSNPIVRRCVNIIKDKLTSQKYEFVKKYKDDTNDYSDLIKNLNEMLDNPNSLDTRRTFFSAVDEDLIVGDCGCFEVAKGNKKVYLFPTDGFATSIIVNSDTYRYAQKKSQAGTVTESYVYFKPDEMVYLKKQAFSDNVYGLSPIESAFDQIQAFMETFQYSSEIASNALPKYILNIKGLQDNTLNSFREYFRQECMGTPAIPIVSGESIESKQIAPISEEATFMGYQQFVIAIIALSFGIPPEKLAIAKSNDRSTIAEINENLLQDCIKPYCDVKEDAINQVLRILGLSDKLVFKYIYEETLEQQKSKQDMIVDKYQKDILTRNEARNILGYLSQEEDKYGDDFITLAKAKINQEYGINGFGSAKQNNTGG